MILADTVAGQGRQLAVFLAVGAFLGIGLWLIGYLRYIFRIGDVAGGMAQGAFSLGVFAIALYIEHFFFGGELAFFHAAALVVSALALFALLFRFARRSRDSARSKCDKLKAKLSGGRIGRFLLK